MTARKVALQAIGNFDEGGAGLGVKLGQPGQVVFRQAGDLRHAGQRIVGQAGLQLGPANGVLRQPGRVVPAVVHDVLRQAEGQGAIAAGVGGQVPVGQFGGARAARIDDHHLGAVFACLEQVRHEVRRGAHRVVAPDDDQLAVLHVFVGLAAAAAQRGLYGKFGRRTANGARQLAGAETVPETAVDHPHLQQPQRAAVAVGQNRFCAKLGNDAPPALANLTNRLIPADLLPLPAALWPDAAQRVGEPVGMVDVVEIRPYLGAQPALGDGVVGVAVELDGTAVFHLRHNAASIGTIMRASPAHKFGSYRSPPIKT